MGRRAESGGLRRAAAGFGGGSFPAPGESGGPRARPGGPGAHLPLAEGGGGGGEEAGPGAAGQLGEDVQPPLNSPWKVEGGVRGAGGVQSFGAVRGLGGGRSRPGTVGDAESGTEELQDAGPTPAASPIPGSPGPSAPHR